METETAKHTPGPWEIRDNQEIIVREGGGTVRLIAQCHAGHSPERSANAAYIVRACNSHEELLQALKVLLDHTEEQYPHFESIRGINDKEKARAAIANAEGPKSP